MRRALKVRLLLRKCTVIIKTAKTFARINGTLFLESGRDDGEKDARDDNGEKDARNENAESDAKNDTRNEHEK